MDKVEVAPALGAARSGHDVKAPTVSDVPVPGIPVKWVHACAARKKRRGQRLMATGTADSCTACRASIAPHDGETVPVRPSGDEARHPTSCIAHDVTSHVVQLPCYDTSTTHMTSPGQKFRLDECDVDTIVKMVKSIAWPSNARRVVNGKGECLGATNDANGAKLGKNTTQREAFCKTFNNALAGALGDTPFLWGSLQVNVNSVSEEHRDANN